MTTPFQGQNSPPSGGVAVFTSVILDRMLNVDDAAYCFEAIFEVILTWTDPRAAAAVAGMANATTCARPCTSHMAWRPGQPCCDAIWLPHLEFTNVRAFPDSRVARHRLVLGEGGVVAWSAHLHAEFFTPMTFAAFPFDNQLLLVQASFSDDFPNDPVSFVPSTTALQLFQPRTGIVLPGWTVRSMQIMQYSSPVSPILLPEAEATPSAAGDPWPLNPAPGSNSTLYRGALWHQGWVAAIRVHRISGYYVVYIIIPLLLITLISLLVYGLVPEDLSTRLSIVTSLFLALTALQFIFSGYLPSSSRVVPTQQLCLLTYFVLAVIGVESIAVHRLVTRGKRRARARRTGAAARGFEARVARVHGRSGSLCCGAGAASGHVANGDGCGAEGGDFSRRSSAAESIWGSESAEEEGRLQRAPPRETPAPSRLASFQSGKAPGKGAAAAGPPGDGGSTPAGAGGPPPPPQRSGWLRYQWLRLGEVRRELGRSHAFADLWADRLDTCTFWGVLLGYTVAVAVIFAVESEEQPTLTLIKA